LTIPPLTERREDIPYLVEHFIQRFNAKRGKRVQGVTPAVMEILMRHQFPGNARELENLIEYCFVLCRNGSIDVKHLPQELQTGGDSSKIDRQHGSMPPLQQSEVDTIRAALGRHEGHQGRVAEELGISRTTLWRKMSKYAIRANEFQSRHVDTSVPQH
jgi:transcriptional regulator with PAS, ATPase and Fis domain